ncbi:phage virion morphogenesis protein [Azohydromonas lata]|uniref:Phage virion morphogenesis protein n=1 Tax=Azohydromonas lata TaxID=45677 RepID=A0ABU5ID01_9BURK|nr:phage virion morphogenesis protein [Azohydromonas lata]MDZ5457000.1 phage virion morphogenesis protein [Azohydromonas lata]
MDGLTALEAWVGPLLAKLSRSEIRRLSVTIARDLRRSQQQRIASQQNPDGSPYEPRKEQKRLRDQVGSLRRGAMFSKLRTARYMLARADAEGALVGFLGRAARIAAVHQEGLRDRVQPGGPEVQYPVRELLGFTPAEIEHLRDQLLQHLAR